MVLILTVPTDFTVPLVYTREAIPLMIFKYDRAAHYEGTI